MADAVWRTLLVGERWKGFLVIVVQFCMCVFSGEEVFARR